MGTIKRRVADGTFPALRDGGLVRIRLTDIDIYLDHPLTPLPPTTSARNAAPECRCFNAWKSPERSPK
ncbi:hypothetical protein [Jatrophihabitans telluris]|uniref:hypothetical protein n=1 Tax=Jatrophihabitans telluris TaxID=2038343 RepID=UPI003D31F60D